MSESSKVSFIWGGKDMKKIQLGLIMTLLSQVIIIFIFMQKLIKKIYVN